MTDEGMRSLVDQARTAINQHDRDAFLDCFDETYGGLRVHAKMQVLYA
jgi:hypothetical protein